MSASRDAIAAAGRAAGQAAPPPTPEQLQAASLLAGPVREGTDEEQEALAAHLENVKQEAAEHTPAA